ncbi:MAG: hypothetical protein K1X53_14830 [Candidatus Sumerlaeaceae bacterium]|nr:hypothetical protein [Candidatus Sumerlaeaceae bacterium]
MAVGRKTTASAVESAVGALILVALVAIAFAVYQKQFRYDAALFSPPAETSEHDDGGSPGQAEAGSGFAALLPASLKVMGAAETFDRESLSDKIDGKAELYLECGFESLTCQRVADAAKPAAWFELFVYDMGSPLNAFAVFSNQRRSDAQPADVGPFAYTAGASLFVSHGRHYVEAIASEISPELAASIMETCRNFVRANAAPKTELSALDLLPRENLLPNSAALLLKDAFGFDKWDNVVTADYTIGGTTTTAFLSRRQSPAEAAELAAAYHTMLTRDMGGENIAPPPSAVPGIRGANMLGDTELVFAVGNFVVGVHAARTAEAASALAAKLDAAIRETGK